MESTIEIGDETVQVQITTADHSQDPSGDYYEYTLPRRPDGAVVLHEDLVPDDAHMPHIYAKLRHDVEVTPEHFVKASELERTSREQIIARDLARLHDEQRGYPAR